MENTLSVKSSNKTDEECLYTEVNRILDLCASQKVDMEMIVKKIVILPIDTIRKMQVLVESVFDKATSSSKSTVVLACALLSRELALMEVPNTNSTAEKQDKNHVNFRQLLVTLCQVKFESKPLDDPLRKDMIQKIERCKDPRMKVEMFFDLEDYDRSLQLRSMRCIRFVGELFKQQMLTVKIMKRCLTIFLDQNDEQSLESFCVLFTLIRADLEKKKKKIDLGKFFMQVDEIVNGRHIKISGRLRFILQNTLENSNWDSNRVWDKPQVASRKGMSWKTRENCYLEERDNSMTMLAPRECLEALRCTPCGKYLSVPPIYITNDGSSYCGRCSKFLDPGAHSVRNVAYESILHFIKFPCIYEKEGCLENLTPSETIAHEKQCPRRLISCQNECIWQGTTNELFQHYEDTHPTLILRNREFEIDLVNSYQIFNVMMFGEELFGVSRRYDSELKQLSVQISAYGLNDTNTKYSYEMKIENGTRSLSVTFPSKSTSDEDNTTEIVIADVLEKLQEPNIMIGSIRILFENSTAELESTKGSNVKNPDINYDMLRELECPVCMDYIIPPIYQCATGHSLCCFCKDKVAQCPTCQSAIGATQNFTLEKMAYFLTYPCKFTEYGCDFTEKPLKIKEHQKYCTHGPRKCPLADYENCKHEDSVKQIFTHIMTRHHDNILEIDLVNVFVNEAYYGKEDSFCYVLKYDSNVFLMHYMYKENEFYFAMQYLGPPEVCKKYKFEIDVVDNSGNNQRLFVRSTCVPETAKADCFNDTKKYLFLHADQVKPFITDQFTFRVRIAK